MLLLCAMIFVLSCQSCPADHIACMICPMWMCMLQVLSVVGLLQDETDPMVSVMKVPHSPDLLYTSYADARRSPV